MKLAANLSWLYTEFDFPDRLQACAEDGFRHAECMFPYEFSPRLLRDRADEAQVKWVLINAPAGNWAEGDRGLATDALRRDEFRRAAEQAAKFAGELNVGKVHVLAGVVDLTDPRATEAAWACYEANLEWLADTMQGVPIDWLIEPINRVDVPGYLLTTQAQAHALVQRLNKPNLGVQLDLYHCQRVQGDALQTLVDYLPLGHVKHLQIAGVPDRTEPVVNQTVPGDQTLDYSLVYQCLRSLNYQGHVGCEYRPRRHTRDGLDWIRSTGFSGTMGAIDPRA